MKIIICLLRNDLRYHDNEVRTSSRLILPSESQVKSPIMLNVNLQKQPDKSAHSHLFGIDKKQSDLAGCFGN